MHKQNQKKMKKVILEEQESVNLADLKQNAIVGFITGYGHKGYVVACNWNYQSVLVHDTSTDAGNYPNSWCGDGVGDTIQRALEFICWGGLGEAYVFETHKELYTWLAE